jgi:DNA mismatch repair protein MutS
MNQMHEVQNKAPLERHDIIPFHSILFEGLEDGTKEGTLQGPSFFVDLNLDQIIDAITSGKEEYNLKPFFYTFPIDATTIEYRHKIMKDIEGTSLFDDIKSFAEGMRAVREFTAQSNKRYYKYQKASWFLDAVRVYCEAVDSLLHALSKAPLKSLGLLSFREYLAAYIRSDLFTSLLSETEKVKADLSSIKYCILIKSNGFTVSKYNDETDYSAEVEKTFAKFKQGAAKNYAIKFDNSLEMNHIEAQVLEFVAQLYPEIFTGLDNFWAKHRDFLDKTMADFDREIQFYVAYLEYIAGLKQAGLKFCYPQIAINDKNVYDYECFDLALAHKLIAENSQVVCNDFHLEGKERIFVVTGPNQGGKTTFARTFGQLHYLASIGCPVPGREARLSMFDRIFTHFEKEENVQNLRGKLEDDLIRIHEILAHATQNSIIIMNEVFASTTLHDAISLSRAVIGKIIQLDSLSVCVTFIDELASLSDKIVSAASTVDPQNPAVRTFKIVRKPADGLAYAMSVAEKHGVTYDQLMRRIAQ